jgi:GntR family transcriptional regulator
MPQATPAPSARCTSRSKGLILQSLQSGEWKPGEAIPSEMDLAARYRVSQGTVRKAIDELAAENLVVRRQGKGTFVATHAEQHVQYRFLRLAPDTGDQRTEGPAERQIVECKRARASAEVARTLALRTGDALLHIRRPFFWRYAHYFGGHLAARQHLQGAQRRTVGRISRPHVCDVRA